MRLSDKAAQNASAASQVVNPAVKPVLWQKIAWFAGRPAAVANAAPRSPRNRSGICILLAKGE